MWCHLNRRTYPSRLTDYVWQSDTVLNALISQELASIIQFCFIYYDTIKEIWLICFIFFLSGRDRGERSRFHLLIHFINCFNDYLGSCYLFIYILFYTDLRPFSLTAWRVSNFLTLSRRRILGILIPGTGDHSNIVLVFKLKECNRHYPSEEYLGIPTHSFGPTAETRVTF